MTARGILLLAAVGLGIFAGTAGAVTTPSTEPEPPAGKAPRKPTPPPKTEPAGKTIVFPVVGPARFSDDYGDARGSGRHDGNDIMAPKKALAVAAEAGKVKFWTTSWRAGCMLYLYGKSGTTYLYVHLNNDLTMKNDNDGKCVAGVAYAKGLKSGDSVVAGQPVGYVGDSGDADGIAAHLHFEMHPGDKASTNPYPHLKKARRLLFAAPPKAIVSLALTGRFVSTLPQKVQVRVDSLRVSTGLRVREVGRVVRLRMPQTAFVEWVGGIPVAVARLASLAKGQPLTAYTAEDFVTLDAQLGKPDVLEVRRILLAKT
ncbi:MAG: M23 family metallopeptidase [Actinomycetota bacterium]|nr:M23 family metallopeptidase [Actinomycetota bacterium]